jgi:hypothetical protein
MDNRFTLKSEENRFEYGLFIGDRMINDAGRGGLTLDFWAGFAVGYRDYHKKYPETIENEIIFNDVNSDPFSMRVLFGLNLGFMGPIKKTSTL